MRFSIFYIVCLLMQLAGVDHLLMAQGEPSFSTYALTPIIINSAYAGSEEVLSVVAVERRQWTKLEGAPSSQVVAIHSPLKDGRRISGVLFQRDKIGVTSRSSFSGIYGTRIHLNQKNRLTLSLKGGISNLVSRLSELGTRLPDDPVMENDRLELFTPLLGAGFLWSSQCFFAGLSSPDLLEPDFRRNQYASLNYRNYFLQLGTIVKSNREISWVPSVLLKYNKATHLLVDLNSLLILKEALWLSCSYRKSVSWNFMIQGKLTNQLMLGYSYDYPVGEYAMSGGGSHEFKLSYNFELFKSNYLMPRYF